MTGEDRADETALAPFFAAARAEEPAPRSGLLNAIIADAAEVSAGRAAVPARRTAPAPRWQTLFAPVGGWPGLAALGVCAALGFWAGMSGSAGTEAAAWWTETTADLGDPVADFFDLATVEG
jgi:hypothetical protein